MTERDFKLLNALVETPGLPGREHLISELIQASLHQVGWTTSSNPVGNMIARKPGKGIKILLVAHMDEVGLIVRRITPNGFLQVERLGGISLHALPGAELELWTANGRRDVHIGLPAEHLVHGNETQLQLESLFVDAGVRSQEEARAIGIRVGDGMTWHSPLRQTGTNRITGKALDNRTGCYALIQLANRLVDVDLDEDLTLAFVSQEECMVLESAPVVRALNPDVLIGIDGTLTYDTPDITEPHCEIHLGNGPCLKIMDAIRGKNAYLPDWQLTQRIRDYMEVQELPFQSEVVVGLSTAVSLMPFMNHGIKSVSFSLPIRYHHSPVETADTNDLDALINLLYHLLTDKVLV